MKPRSPRATRTPRRPNADAVAVFMATPCQREGSRTTQAPLRSAPPMRTPVRNSPCDAPVPPRSAGGMWQPPAVFTATTWRRGRSHTMRAPLLSAPADVNAPAQPPARCEHILHAPQTGFTPPQLVLRLPHNGFYCVFTSVHYVFVHNVASGPLEEALAASISPMSNRSFTWTSGLPPEAYLLVKPGMNVQGPNRAIKVASRACLGVPAMLDVAMPVDAAAAAGTPTALGLLHKLSFGVGLGSPLAFCAASCTLPLLSLLSPLPALTSLSTRWTDLTPSTSPIFLPALLTFCALYRC
ncbi:hypothetical protein B0H13DRAFT_2348375 [Mycena leptocephala]|nr:hypothetical protein B0H13DRAFT_2348375 [Mycena leptocephala]